MNVVRSDQYFGRRRQNEVGLAAGPSNYKTSTMAPRSANFRVRNQSVSDAWRSGASRTFYRTPIRPITSSSSSSNSKSRRESAIRRSSTTRTSTTCSSSRTRTTPCDPRTPHSTSSIETETNCIIAITEGRGQARGEVGLAAIDIRRPHLVLSQISDSQSYSNVLAKINVFNPVEVLLPNTFCEAAQTNKLFSCVREQYQNITITTVQRRHFNDARGLQLIQSLCAPEFSSVEVLVTHRFYALAAAAALLKYVEFIQNMIFAPKSLRVDYQGSLNTMLIDVDTAQRLELVRGAKAATHNAPYSLLGTLSHCATSGGLRLLRASLLQPPCLVGDIEQRLDCVHELVNSPALFHALQGVLPRMADVEQLLTLSMVAPTTGQASLRHAETQLNYALLLKSSLESLPHFVEALETAETPYLCAVREKLQHEAFDNILEHIRSVLHEDARSTKGFSQAHLQRCFAVRTGINELLDVARKTYCELVDDVTEMVNKYKEEFGLPMRVGFSSTRGFHIQLPLTGPHGRLRSAELPPVFIQVVKSRSTVTMTTQELVHADQRCKDALHEIHTMSNVVISELLAETRQHAGCLYQLCEAVAQVDLLMALASVSVLPGYVRPSFGSVTCLQASRHPILAFLHHTEPVANNIFSSVDNNFHILTGPNMGGKSIYIRQVALLQVLAQVGCYVPAESATFRVADRIFSRIGFEDSIENNASTFVLEMREMQFILQNVTDNSLVIVDELCRGTSSEEGTAIAWALCERLLSCPAFTFFTTHFLFLTRLQDLYPNVTNHHMEALETNSAAEEEPAASTPLPGTSTSANMEGEEQESWIHYTHRVLPGVTKLERYGLRLARLSLMPTSVVTKADTLLQQLSSTRKPQPHVGGSNCLEREFFCLCAEVVRAAAECGTDSETLRSRCKEIQARFVSEYPDWEQSMPSVCTPPSLTATYTPVKHFEQQSCATQDNNTSSPFLQEFHTPVSQPKQQNILKQKNISTPKKQTEQLKEKSASSPTDKTQGKASFCEDRSAIASEPHSKEASPCELEMQYTGTVSSQATRPCSVVASTEQTLTQEIFTAQSDFTSQQSLSAFAQYSQLSDSQSSFKVARERKTVVHKEIKISPPHLCPQPFLQQSHLFKPITAKSDQTSTHFSPVVSSSCTRKQKSVHSHMPPHSMVHDKAQKQMSQMFQSLTANLKTCQFTSTTPLHSAPSCLASCSPRSPRLLSHPPSLELTTTTCEEATVPETGRSPAIPLNKSSGDSDLDLSPAFSIAEFPTRYSSASYDESPTPTAKKPEVETQSKSPVYVPVRPKQRMNRMQSQQLSAMSTDDLMTQEPPKKIMRSD